MKTKLELRQLQEQLGRDLAAKEAKAEELAGAYMAICADSAMDETGRTPEMNAARAKLDGLRLDIETLESAIAGMPAKIGGAEDVERQARVKAAAKLLAGARVKALKLCNDFDTAAKRVALILKALDDLHDGTIEASKVATGNNRGAWPHRSYIYRDRLGQACRDADAHTVLMEARPITSMKNRHKSTAELVGLLE